MNIKDEYIKFLKNYKTLFKKYIKEIGKAPFLDGELTGEFEEFKSDLDATEFWEKEFEEMLL